MIRKILQNAIIGLVRPYTVRELPGWGRIYGWAVGHDERDWFWEGAKPRTMRGKFDGYLTRQDISKSAGRLRYFLLRWSQLEIQSFVSDTISPDDIVVDVGANVGDFSLFASAKAKSVLCFEPNPNCCQIIAHHIKLNDINNIVVHQVGLGDHRETLRLNMTGPLSALATFGTVEATFHITAEVATGDEALVDENPKLIKIDAEGFETNVIRGLVRTIERCHPILLTEVARSHLARCGSSPEELQTLVEGLGYRGFQLKLSGRDGSYSLAKLISDLPEFDAVWLPI